MALEGVDEPKRAHRRTLNETHELVKERKEEGCLEVGGCGGEELGGWRLVGVVERNSGIRSMRCYALRAFGSTAFRKGLKRLRQVGGQRAHLISFDYGMHF